jgi:hypothetical protein
MGLLARTAKCARSSQCHWGRGYTVEAQISGEKAIGSLLVEATPLKSAMAKVYNRLMSKPPGMEYFKVEACTLDGERHFLRVNKDHTVDEVKLLTENEAGPAFGRTAHHSPRQTAWRLKGTRGLRHNRGCDYAYG